MNNIILTGLSGSGKTTLGRLLAEKLGMECIDTDCLIEQQQGVTIKEIFARHGEQHFRDLETQAIRSLSGTDSVVVATGGGAVLRRENVQALQSTGILIFLDRPVKNILQDLACEGRPLLQNGGEKLYDMEKQRRALYEDTADRVFVNSGSLEEALLSLLAEIRAWRYDKGYAVIGSPIAHSLSPAIHQAVFGTLGISDDYQSVCIKDGELPGFVRRVRMSGIKGFNITSPHKKNIIPLLDEVDGEAVRCGSVNTVVKRGGRLYGFNTDMEGLSLAIRDQGFGYSGSRVTILGTGGAAVGVALRAALEGAVEIRIHGRREEAVREVAKVAESCGTVRMGDLSEQSLAESASDCDVLINTLPLEMTGFGAEVMSLDFVSALPVEALVCDIVYSPPRTRLLKAAETHGCRVLNGLPMLIYQAILADEHYLQRGLDRRAFYKIIVETLQSEDKERAV